MSDIGIVDLGSNSARLVVYNYLEGAWYRLVDDIREPVRLGEGLWSSNRLQKKAIKRTLAALELFGDYARSRNLDTLEVIGTSAVRDAENRDEFLEKIRGLDLDVAILTGEEEAQLGTLAVANGFAVPDAWVMDLGGGSAQIALMQSRQCVEGASYPLGAVRLTESRVANDPPTEQEVWGIEEEVAAHLAPVAKKIRKSEAPLIAMGGTIRNLALLAQSESDYPLPIVHGYEFTLSDLDWICDQLAKLPLAERQKLSGINPYRADVILAGALVYRWLLRASKRDSLLISGHGVREGKFFQRFLPAPHLIEDVRRFSVSNLFQRATQPVHHTEQVRTLARTLFEGLHEIHRLGPEHAELLDAAATLHDIGTAVHYYGHHKHSAYLVGAAPLDGYSHREQAIVMQLVRYHHKGTPKRQPYRGLIRSSDKPALLAMATCLRLAEYLERSRARRLANIEIEVAKKSVTLHLVAPHEPTVEMWETQKQEGLFERAFHRKLVLEYRDESTPSS